MSLMTRRCTSLRIFPPRKKQQQENNEMPRMKYFCEGLTPELVKKAEDELGETEEVRIQCLKELKRLIKEEPDFRPLMDDIFLLRFLRAKKFKVEKAFKTLKNYYIFKARYSGVLTDFRASDVKDILEEGHASVLEYRDPNLVGIAYIRAGQYDIDKYTPEEILAFVLTATEIGLTPEATSIAGYSFIVDLAGFSLRMAKHYASPTLLYRMVTAIQDCIPCRVKGYHIVNEPFYFNILFNIVRTFMSEKLSKRVHLHGSNLKSLHKHVSPDILPEELGGRQGPMAKYGKEYIAKILSCEDHYIRVNKYGYQGDTLHQLRKDNSNAILT